MLPYFVDIDTSVPCLRIVHLLSPIDQGPRKIISRSKRVLFHGSLIRSRQCDGRFMGSSVSGRGFSRERNRGSTGQSGSRRRGGRRRDFSRAGTAEDSSQLSWEEGGRREAMRREMRGGDWRVQREDPVAQLGEGG